MAQPPVDEAVRSAGRGGLALLGAKLYFMVIGLVQQIALKAVLGLSGYGAYSTAQSIASITYNPVVQTSIQGVSREIAGHAPEQRPAVLRQLLVIHALAALALSLLFLLLAGPVSRGLGAPHVATTLRILSVVVGVYGVYAPLIGVLNGLRRFLPQALLDVSAATLRTVGLLAGAWLALRLTDDDSPIARVEGANLGFAVASLGILLVALLLTGVGREGPPVVTLARYARFALPVLGGQLLLNLLFQADSLVLRRLAADAALTASLPQEAADPLVGAYRAAQLFCFLPYQLLMSVTFVLFPLLAAARATGDTVKIRAYVEGGVRLATLLATLMVSVLVALPGGLIGLVYGEDAASLGAPAMRPLALGLGSFALLGVMTSALNSLGRPGLSLRITGLAALLIVGSTYSLGHGQALGAALPFRVALATAASLLLATIYTGVLLKRTAGGVIPWKNLLRILFCGALAATATSWLLSGGSGHAGPLQTLFGAVFCSLLAMALLVVTRELTGKDLARLLTVFGRR